MLNYKTIYTKEIKSNCEWVLLIHGIGGNFNMFKKQIDVLSNYNILLIDLHGHGGSMEHTLKQMKKQRGDINFKYICDDVVKIFEKLNIKKVHIMGVSLGSIVAMQFEKYYPNKIHSMILGGAIIGMNRSTKFLLNLGNCGKYLLPRSLFYKIVAYSSMPCKRHKISRDIFIKASKKLNKCECVEWTKLITSHIRTYEFEENSIKKIFIMGDEDYVFINSIRKNVPKDILVILKKCGHICNIDSYKEFNELCLSFLGNNLTKPDYMHIDTEAI